MTYPVLTFSFGDIFVRRDATKRLVATAKIVGCRKSARCRRNCSWLILGFPNKGYLRA